MFPVTEVYVKAIKPTGNEEIFQVQLEQIFEREVTNSSSLLSFTMGGATGFTSSKVKRTVFQNFSAQNINNWNMKEGFKLVDIPSVEKAKIIVLETQTPRSWIDRETGEKKFQSPKTAGEGGEVLTFQGNPIYRNTALALNSMSFEDKFIQHDNVVKGSSNAAIAEVKAEIVGDSGLPF